MSRSKKKRPETPHHIFHDLEAGDIKSISVRKGLQQLEVLGPDATMKEIRETVTDNHGPGRYRVMPTSIHTGNPLRGFVTLEIADDYRDFGEGYRFEEERSSQQLGFVAEQTRSLELARQRLAKDREDLVDGVLVQKTAVQDAQSKAMGDFLTKQAELAVELEKKKLVLEAQAERREAERRDRHDIELAKIETKRTEFEAKIAATTRDEFEMKLEHERKLFELQIEQMKASNQLMIEQVKREMDIERQRLDFESKQKDEERSKKFGLASQAGLPQDIFEELQWRRLNEEFPEKSDLEKVVEKYIDPIFSFIQAKDPEFRKRLADGMSGDVSSDDTVDTADQVIFSTRDSS